MNLTNGLIIVNTVLAIIIVVQSLWSVYLINKNKKLEVENSELFLQLGDRRFYNKIANNRKAYQQNTAWSPFIIDKDDET